MTMEIIDENDNRTYVLENKKIGFIGSGNMGEALIDGLIHSDRVKPNQILATDASKERSDYITETYGITLEPDAEALAKDSDIIMLAIKPADVASVLFDIAPLVKGKLLISIAAGITTEFIKKTLSDNGTEDAAIIRVMPNTPALIGEGAIGILAGKGTHSQNLFITEEIFRSVGEVAILDDEALMDSVTGLSGSGPAYVFLFIKSLIEGGIKEGLDEKTATMLAIKTVVGASKLAEISDASLDDLIDMVSSPGGTTVEGLKALREGKMPETIHKAVSSATKRSKELSGG